MQKIKVAVLGALIIFLSGCNNDEAYVIRADEGQLGGGSTITMTGNIGRIRTDALTGFPNGLDEGVKEVKRAIAPTGGFWKVETETKLKLSFIVAAGAYICDSCVEVGLPVTWHRDRSKK